MKYNQHRMDLRLPLFHVTLFINCKCLKDAPCLNVFLSSIYDSTFGTSKELKKYVSKYWVYLLNNFAGIEFKIFHEVWIPCVLHSVCPLYIVISGRNSTLQPNADLASTLSLLVFVVLRVRNNKTIWCWHNTAMAIGQLASGSWCWCCNLRRMKDTFTLSLFSEQWSGYLKVIIFTVKRSSSGSSGQSRMEYLTEVR